MKAFLPSLLPCGSIHQCSQGRSRLMSGLHPCCSRPRSAICVSITCWVLSNLLFCRSVYLWYDVCIQRTDSAHILHVRVGLAQSLSNNWMWSRGVVGQHSVTEALPKIPVFHCPYPSISRVQGAVTYQLPSANTTWSTVFRQLENNKGRLNIIDYSVSQTTLEQVSNAWTVPVISPSEFR